MNSSYPYSPEDEARGYSGSSGFKLLLPFPYSGQQYSYSDPDIPDLTSHYTRLQQAQGRQALLQCGTRDRVVCCVYQLYLCPAGRAEAVWEDPVELVLPPGLAVQDITFLSVWCRKLGINFGAVEFPLKNILYN